MRLATVVLLLGVLLAPPIHAAPSRWGTSRVAKLMRHGTALVMAGSIMLGASSLVPRRAYAEPPQRGQQVTMVNQQAARFRLPSPPRGAGYIDVIVVGKPYTGTEEEAIARDQQVDVDDHRVFMYWAKLYGANYAYNKGPSKDFSQYTVSASQKRPYRIVVAENVEQMVERVEALMRKEGKKIGILSIRDHGNTTRQLVGNERLQSCSWDKQGPLLARLARFMAPKASVVELTGCLVGQDDRLLSDISTVLGEVYVKGATITQNPPPGFEGLEDTFFSEAEVKVALGTRFYYKGSYYNGPASGSPTSITPPIATVAVSTPQPPSSADPER